MSIKYFLRDKLIEDISRVGCIEWTKSMLDSEEKLAEVFSAEIEEALSFGKDVERPIGIIRDRLSSFINGDRNGQIRLVQFATLRKMQFACDSHDAIQFLQILLSGFHSEKSDQYYSRPSRDAAIRKSNFDDSVYSDDYLLELEFMREDAKKIAEIEPLNTKKRLFKFWIENFKEEDVDHEWFEAKCSELGFDISDVLNGFTKTSIDFERAASGNSQLVFNFEQPTG